MAKGKRNSQKKGKSSKGTDDGENGNGDEGVRKCPHLSKSVKLNSLQNKIPHTTLGQCLDCGELDASEAFGVCICLCCAHQGCDRNSEEKHALSHNKSSPSHNVVVHLQNWVVWCYACDDDVPVEPETVLYTCIKLILKAMNASPPPELGASFSSPSKVSSENSKKDGSKANGQLKSQIKGLANLGNTCFFNSVMQNLCQTELLYVAASFTAQRDFSYHVSPNGKELSRLKVKIEDAPGAVTTALWKLLQDFRTSTDRTLTPKQLFSEICKKATRFKGFRQQDSQELLRYLLDSIRSEELRRVKVAVLSSFGVTSGGDAKSLDDNKREQVKEYGASAEAPLIDSVFAGRLVSIVTCHQCHQEFKVEETFLDLSLPLTSPPQESFSNKFFAKGGKQNPKSPKTPNHSSKSVEENDKHKETDPGKTKSPSKHQQKAARKAERKKGKKGKGHGKKGKMSKDADDNKQEDDGTERAQSDEEGHELDQMNVSDLDGSDNEQGDRMSQRVGSQDDDNQTKVSENPSAGSEVIPNIDAQLKDAKSISKHSEVSEKDLDTCVVVDSNMAEDLADNTVDCSFTEQMETVEDVSKYSKENREMQNEQGAMQFRTENIDCLNERGNENTSVNYKGNDMPDEEDKISSMKISNSDQGTQLNSDFLQSNTEKMAEEDSLMLPCTERGTQLLATMSTDCEMKSGHQHFQHGSQEKQPNDEIPSSIKEFLEEIVNLALNLSLDNADKRQHKHDSSRSSEEFTSTITENPSGENSPQEERDFTIENAATETLPQGNSEIICESSCEKSSTETRNALEKTDGVERKSNIVVAGLVEEVPDCARTEQETSTVENERPYSDSAKGNEKGELSEESEHECETDSEEEYENEHRTDRILTLQPAYEAAPGECSVMSCLSQFCASELLDGNNKFACEMCTKRAQRVKKGKGSRSPKDDDKDDVSGESSSEDEPKGAKAGKSSRSKYKESTQQTVYTVASKQLLISLAPPVLTLHLKRFQQARFTLQKLTKHVEFPLELNLAPFCSKSGRSRADSEGQVLYSLYGIIQHSGSMNSGHYTAYVKVREPPVKSLYDNITSLSDLTDFLEKMWTQKPEAKHGNYNTRHEPAPNGQWFHVSDSSVSTAAETKVIKSQAYMLFYGRLPLSSR